MLKTSISGRQRSWRKPALGERFKSLFGFTSISEDKFAKKLCSMLQNYEPWVIEYLKITNSSLEISGWAIAPQGNHSSVSFTVNDEKFDYIDYPILREDVKNNAFWYYPGAEKSGFLCKTKLSKEKTKRHIVLKFIDRETKKPFNDLLNYYYDVDNLSVPGGENMTRVIGNDNISVFLVDGFTTYVKLEQVLKRVFNKSYNDFSNILDWGCGCGRITRHFRNTKTTSIHGVDIDQENIDWCKENLKNGNFLSIPLHPPTGLKDSYFDLIIGISVFTHLTEKDQYEWLNELKRITSDNAVLLLTIHSDVALCRSNLPASFFDKLKKEGINFDLSDPRLDDVIKEKGYYRCTYHTHDYILKNWSKYFEIIDIIPGYTNTNLQDLVVMRR